MIVNKQNLINFVTSDKAVVQGNKDNEDGIEHGQDYEEAVKAVLHLLHWEHQHRHDVTNQTDNGHHYLQDKNDYIDSNIIKWAVPNP